MQGTRTSDRPPHTHTPELDPPLDSFPHKYDVLTPEAFSSAVSKIHTLQLQRRPASQDLPACRYADRRQVARQNALPAPLPDLAGIPAEARRGSFGHLLCPTSGGRRKYRRGTRKALDRVSERYATDQPRIEIVCK